MNERKVKIFTTPMCPFCVMAKEFLRIKNVSYREFDVSEDADARRQMVEASGQLGVPVILIDGKVVVGFNQTELDSLLTEG